MNDEPTADDFRKELLAQIARGNRRGAPHVEINSGELHRAVGGYPRPNHRMAVCCEVMERERKIGDEIISAPERGKGASLTIRYMLPRK
jgi:hypothetical protein